jgi:hypothetical protein
MSGTVVTVRFRAPQNGVVEITETVTTCDQPFTDRDGSWGTRIVRPPRPDWKVADGRPGTSNVECPCCGPYRRRSIGGDNG